MDAQIADPGTNWKTTSQTRRGSQNRDKRVENAKKTECQNGGGGGAIRLPTSKEGRYDGWKKQDGKVNTSEAIIWRNPISPRRRKAV